MRKMSVVLAAAVAGGLLFWIGRGFGAVGADFSQAPAAGAGVLLRETALSILPIEKRRGELLVGTRRFLYRTSDGGKSWKRIFCAGAWKGVVRCVVVHPADGDRLWITAGEGLWASRDGGKRWVKVFSGHGELLSLAVGSGEPCFVLAGTTLGAYVSLDGGAAWKGCSVGLPAGPVLSAAWNHLPAGRFYAQMENGLYRLNLESVSWERVSLHSSAGSADGTEEIFADSADSGQEELLAGGSLAVDPATGGLYVGSAGRIFVSWDGGMQWESLSAGGMGTPWIRRIVPGHSGASIFVLTSRGIFRRDLPGGFWKPIAGPVSGEKLRSAALNPEDDSLWIGAEGGLFRLHLPQPAPADGSSIRLKAQMSEPGPSVHEIQQAAVRYAEVGPEKISGWRMRAGLSGWMPRVSLNFDRDKNRTIASSTANGKTAFFVGPEDQSAGLGVDFSWELGHLIWNPDQVSIDARSRLMVQLRQDILEEVTRLYFERKRLQTEFSGSVSDDPKLLYERRLRIEEVEANIDALTNGYFSENKNNMS